MKKLRSLLDFEEQLRSLLPLLEQKYLVKRLGIFGSYARGEQGEVSDLDLLVAFKDPPGLFRYIELENYISESLGVKVDLVMEDAIKSNLRERILKEVQTIKTS
jgi:predicted nucleotidyltransferase